jgi:uncharacterized protein
MSLAAYRITVDGTDVSSNFAPVLTELEICDSDGGKADTCTIVLDDSGGRIQLPQPGSQIEALIWWQVPPPWSNSGGSVQFTGVTDEPRSYGRRHSGTVLSISAKSADLSGLGKQKIQKHFDNTTFGSVAQQIGQMAGYNVSVASALSSIQRDYWIIPHESFLSWGRRIADEIGATFKTAFPQATFVPRNSPDAAGGLALGTVSAIVGQNVIGWDVSPICSRGIYNNSIVRVYDSTQAKWSCSKTSVGGSNGSSAKSDLNHTFKAPDVGRASLRAAANADSAQRAQGSGSVEIDGEPAAMSQANLVISGAREGVDGTYIIKTARHFYSRHAGWATRCEIEQPSGNAGTDSRGSDEGSSAGGGGGGSGGGGGTAGGGVDDLPATA